MDKNLEHLRLLSVFHYVVGGLAALFSMIPIIHLTIGTLMVSGKLADQAKDAAPLAAIGWVMIVIATVIILMGLTFAVCLILAGRNLARRTHYTFCLVMAAISCIFMPFGTVLGVLTLLVLMRDGVRDLFDQPSGA